MHPLQTRSALGHDVRTCRCLAYKRDCLYRRMLGPRFTCALTQLAQKVHNAGGAPVLLDRFVHDLG